MCFDTTKLAKAKIAQADIKCWKVIREDNSPVYVWSHGITTPYIKGEDAPRVIIKKQLGSFNNYIIREGYHSCKIRKGLINTALYKGRGSITRSQIKTARFIIPKGTRYYENEKEYVSETIMLVS